MLESFHDVPLVNDLFALDRDKLVFQDVLLYLDSAEPVLVVTAQ